LIKPLYEGEWKEKIMPAQKYPLPSYLNGTISQKDYNEWIGGTELHMEMCSLGSTAARVARRGMSLSTCAGGWRKETKVEVSVDDARATS
jgi:hypothetical protein